MRPLGVAALLCAWTLGAADDVLPREIGAVGEEDIFRESMLRYMGYANEVGEALRPVAPAIYYPSYFGHC